MGLFLQDMDSMVSITMAIEREIDDARSIRNAGASEKRKKDQPSLNSRKKHRISIPRDHSVQGHSYQSQGQERASIQTVQVTCYHYHQLRHFRHDCPQRQRSQGYGTPQSSITTTSLDTLGGIAHRGRDPKVMGYLSLNHQWDMHISNLFLLTPAWARGTSIYPRVQHRHRLDPDKTERPGHGSRSRTGLSDQDFRDPGACLSRDTSD